MIFGNLNMIDLGRHSKHLEASLPPSVMGAAPNRQNNYRLGGFLEGGADGISSFGVCHHQYLVVAATP